MNTGKIKQKKAVIIAASDAYANAVKPNELRKYLEQNNFNVELLPTAFEARVGKGLITKHIPLITPLHMQIIIILALIIAKITPFKVISRTIKSAIRIPLNKSYAKTTHERLVQLKPDLIICESNFDIGFTTLPRVAKMQILDLPCPWAEELFYGRQINRKAFERLKKYEIESYEAADSISFHWHTYADFVKKNKYKGSNFIDMSYGTNPKTLSAKYNDTPRVIFLGYLGGYWVNTQLLEKLCKAYPLIDVYGGPKPPKGSAINYKGYAPTLDIIANYQFGLITISDDNLRRHSFSSKHLEYISYGLPVFTPEWRKDRKLDSSSIYYSNVDDFLKLIELYKKKNMWLKKSRSASNLSHNLSWSTAFQQLDTLLINSNLVDKK